MTSETRIFDTFQSDMDNKWYFWKDAWQTLAGQFDQYAEAHMALSEYLQERYGEEESG